MFDDIRSVFELMHGAVVRSLLLIQNLSEEAHRDDGSLPEKINWRHLMPVLRGIFLAIPVVFLFSLLLMSADVVFADKMKLFFDLFDIHQLVRLTFRLLAENDQTWEEFKVVRDDASEIWCIEYQNEFCDCASNMIGR